MGCCWVMWSHLLLVLVVRVGGPPPVVFLRLIGNATGALWFYNISFCAAVHVILFTSVH